MREGVNPRKADVRLNPFPRHRVLTPVFIPSDDGYFRHAKEILRLCLESLWLTAHGRVAITVISNGSSPDVVAMLQSLLDRGWIHQLVLNGRNWGKIDAVLSVAHGRFEPLITVADADVLFLPGWVDAVERLFEQFPECGFATPAPNPSLAYLHTTSTIFAALARGQLHFESVVPTADLDQFARSIGRPGVFRPEHRVAQMVVRRNGTAAVVGGGHFVFTLRREVIRRIPRTPSLTALRPLGETAWFDDPPDAFGVWRLSTARAYAYHMGNVPEPWMYEGLERCRSDADPAVPVASLPPLRPSVVSRFPLAWRKKALAAIRRYALQPRWSGTLDSGAGHA